MKIKENSSNAACVVPRYKKIIAVVISAFFIIYPFITYLKVMKLTGKTSEVFPNEQGISADFFLYWKAAALIGFALFLLLFFAGEFVFPDKPVKTIPLFRKDMRFPLVCVGVYSFFAVLSAVLSSARDVCMIGSPTSCEGVFVLLGYMIVFLAGINYFGGTETRRILFRALLILAGITAVLALVEYLYQPIFELPFMAYLIAPSQYREVAASLHHDGFTNFVALSFYNPDYFGGFCALLFPLTLSAVVQAGTKVKKLLLSGLSLIFCVALLLSRSSGALYACLASLVLWLLLYRRSLWHGLPYMVAFFAAGAVLFTAVNAVSGGRFFTSLKGDFTNTTTSPSTKTKFLLRDLSFQGDTLTLMGSSDTLCIHNQTGHAELEALSFTDQNQTVVYPKITNGTLSFADGRFRAVRFSIQQQTLVIELGYKDTIEFYMTKEGFKAVGQNGCPLDSIPSLNPLLKNWYPIATGRGYTWVNSLPLVKDSLIFGKGPDAFAFSFPQNDIVGLLNTHESAKFMIDKPHNFYLQTGIQTGMVSLLALLALFAGYLIRGIRQYWVHAGDKMEIGLFAGVTAFLITGLVNDSMVVVNPLFWLMLGIGYAHCQEYKKQ